METIEYTEADIPSRGMASHALLTQGACNIGGLVHGLDRATTELQVFMRTNPRTPEWLRGHPVIFLYLYQLAFLASGMDWDIPDGTERWRKATELCLKVEGKTSPSPS